MGRLTERVAVITGGGSGIGRATAVRFAEQGAVAVVVDIDAKGAATTVELIRERRRNRLLVRMRCDRRRSSRQRHEIGH